MYIVHFKRKNDDKSGKSVSVRVGKEGNISYQNHVYELQGDEDSKA